MQQEIIFEELAGEGGALGLITLNRPHALNALNLTMSLALDRQLQQWANDDGIKAVVIQGTGDKAFCAGGDLRYLYEIGRQDYAAAQYFFWVEYRLSHRIYHFPKPYIALMDGITMGGGVGAAIHGTHRVVTERLVFAMPETGIGLFPDVGGSYFLSRCPGETGMFLGLTGSRIQAADAIYLGLAEISMASQHLATLLDSLRQTAFTNNQQVSAVLQAFHQPLGEAQLASQRVWIDACFGQTDVAAMRDSLVQYPQAQTVLANLAQKSPTSLTITFEQIRRGRELSFPACMQMEYRMVSEVLKHPDLYEGIRAVIIDKDHQAKWQPKSLDEMTLAQVANYFAEPKGGDLQFDD